MVKRFQVQYVFSYFKQNLLRFTFVGCYLYKDFSFLWKVKRKRNLSLLYTLIWFIYICFLNRNRFSTSCGWILSCMALDIGGIIHRKAERLSTCVFDLPVIRTTSFVDSIGQQRSTLMLTAFIFLWNNWEAKTS